MEDFNKNEGIEEFEDELQDFNEEMEFSEESSKTQGKDLNVELLETKDHLMRVAAEYENFRKRTEKEKAMIYSIATEAAVLQILPIIDSIEMVFCNMDDVSEPCKKGIDMIRTQLAESLAKLGVEPFGKSGDKFTPELYSAVAHDKGEEESENEIVSDVFRKGYKLGGKVIRHAVVRVKN
ncbi:MAG: nucleotide exchange factor GrpE [Oscillospiraceae bacterium]|nr:nucleotide exchange factor GrpE [Oscillospiraceae bacterium]